MQKRIAIIAGGVVVVLVAGFFGVRAYRAHVQNVAVQKTATTYTQAFAKRHYAKLASQVNLKDLPVGYTKKSLIAITQPSLIVSALATSRSPS